MTEARIEIDRMPIAVTAAASAERAEVLVRRVRDAIARELPAALETACGRTLDGDDRYVFIERLDLRCELGGHWDNEMIGQTVARRLAQALLAHIARGDATAFRNRAEYLAAFIAALIDGGAGSRWWFDEFSGLAPLPPSAAVRTLLCAEPATVVAALARLTQESLTRVVSLVSAADASRMLDAIASLPPVGEVRAAQAINAMNTAGVAGVMSSPSRRLAALVGLERVRAGAAHQGSLQIIDYVSALRRAIGDPRLRELAMEPRADEEILAACGAAAGLTAPSQGLTQADCAALVQDLKRFHCANGARGLTTSHPSEPDAAFGFTPHGGAMILAALLLRTGWWESWRHELIAGAQDRIAGENASNVLALTVVTRALSSRFALAIASDPVVRRVFDVSVGAGSCAVPRRHMRRALVAAVPGAGQSKAASLDDAIRIVANRLLRELAGRLPGCADSTATYLRRQCLECHASISCNPHRVDVHLGPAPLDVLLRLSGLQRADLTLPDGRVFAMNSEEIA